MGVCMVCVSSSNSQHPQILPHIHVHVYDPRDISFSDICDGGNLMIEMHSCHAIIYVITSHDGCYYGMSFII